MAEAQEKFHRVVVIGAGFGGLRVAKSLRGEQVEVTLVDRNNYHLFQPLLYQVATATISADEIAYPVRPAMRGQKNFSFHLGEVSAIDLVQRIVHTSTGGIPYDSLVLAVGGETNFFGLDSVEEHGFGLKSLEDAAHIRNHILRQFEDAVSEPDPDRRRALLTFVVVGGGPTGVECAGAISELIRLVLRKDYPRIDINEVSVILLEAVDTLLSNMPDPLGRRTIEVLRKKHVEVRLKTTVANYDGHRVELKDGTAIPSRTLIWASGVRASSLLDHLPFEKDRAGRVKVLPTLQVPGHPEVFVIGDAAHLEGEDGKPLPMVAPVAMQQAPVAAVNIVRMLDGRSLTEFRYRDPGVMATIGRNQAVAHVWGLKLTGFIAWGMWLVVHIMQLIGFRNRLAVLLDWAWSYIFYERASRLIGPQ